VGKDVVTEIVIDYIIWGREMGEGRRGEGPKHVSWVRST
jgi:hypothetical protein